MRGKSTRAMKNTVDVDKLPLAEAPAQAQVKSLTGEKLDPTVRRIEVLHDYSGRRTAEKHIRPGVYEWDDPELFGLSEYLVDNGHARELA